jgi:hypothetical protein
MSDRYFPDDLLTRAEGAALLRRCGCFNAADALERGIAAPAHLSHNGVPLFRWGTLACWADERRAEEGLGFFADAEEWIPDALRRQFASSIIS